MKLEHVTIEKSELEGLRARLAKLEAVLEVTRFGCPCDEGDWHHAPCDYVAPLAALCGQCQGHGFIEQTLEADGSTTFKVCPGCGLTAEDLHRLCEQVKADGGETSIALDEKEPS